MSETIPSLNDFTQIYQQSMNEDAIAYGGGSDATTSHVLCDGMYSPSNLYLYSSSNQICPSKDLTSKPIRRRSRVSKKTPITLLNANTNNFRALVQQFTGCPRTALSFGDNKGPVNLNFEQGGGQNQKMIFQHQEKHNQFLQGQEQQFQEVYHGQQSPYLFDSVGRSNAVVSTSSGPKSSVEFPDNFSIGNVNFCGLIEDSLQYDNGGL